jgi:hypothetical protein
MIEINQSIHLESLALGMALSLADGGKVVSLMAGAAPMTDIRLMLTSEDYEEYLATLAELAELQAAAAPDPLPEIFGK